MESRQVSGRQSIHYRNYRRARDRALARLSKLYPNVYRDLLEEERELDEQEGTVWSVAGDGRLSVTTRARTVRSSSGRNASNEGKNKSNDGGKA
jgi:hypothetical protein